VRGVLDGHLWLSRKIASRGHYPAIDVLPSISRSMNAIAPREHLQAAAAVRELISAYHDHEDLISIGAYRRGSNPKVDAAVTLQDEINRFLRQDVAEAATIESAREGLARLAGRAMTAAGTKTAGG
jgi:flagellum-specific ATP synthase